MVQVGKAPDTEIPLAGRLGDADGAKDSLY